MSDIEFLASSIFCRTCGELNPHSTSPVCDACRYQRELLPYDDDDEMIMMRQCIYDTIKEKWIPVYNFYEFDLCRRSYCNFFANICVKAAQRGFGRECCTYGPAGFWMWFQHVVDDVSYFKHEKSEFVRLFVYVMGMYSYIIAYEAFSLSHVNYDEFIVPEVHFGVSGKVIVEVVKFMITSQNLLTIEQLYILTSTM